MKTALLCFLVWPMLAQNGSEATLDGRVINAVSGEPVKGARVRIRPVGGGNRLTTSSDATGAIRFAGLTPGRYGIQLEHADFVRGLGRGRSTAFQSIVELGVNEKRTGLVVRITPNGSVEGRVTAQSHEPLDQCTVELLQSQYRQGRVSFGVSGSGATDDHGRYRISNVQPGLYRVRARCEPNPIPFRPLLPEGFDYAGPSLGFAATIRPDPVQVTAGRAARDVDIQVNDIMLYPVVGTVTLPPEAHPAMGLQIALFPIGDEADALIPLATMAQAANPIFRIPAAAPGRYLLIAGAKAGDTFFSARQPVTVTANTPPLRAALSSGIDLTGSVEIRSKEPPASRHISGALMPLQPALSGSRNFEVGEDGTFQLRGVTPGNWRIRLSAPSLDLYLQSIVLGNRELSSPELELTNAAPESLKIVFADGAGGLEVIVQEPEGAPRLHERTIVIEPLLNPNFMSPEQQLATGGPDGRFRIGGLRPGNYRVYALPGLDADVALHPELLRALEPYANVVSVESGKTTSSDIKSIAEELVSSALARI